MIKLIIFDLDGVLVDMKDMHFNVLNEAISEFDKSFIISYEEHISLYDGMKTFDKLKLLTKNKGLPENSYNTIWLNKQKKTSKYIENLQGDPNIIQTLKQLKESGAIIAVASNSIRETVKSALYYTGYIKYIDIFYSNEDVMLAKPSSEIYLKCMISARVCPKETIIVEDSPLGIQAAENSGAFVIKVKRTKDINSSLINKVNTMNKIAISNKWSNDKLNIVIPMAGAASRFEKAGYTFPKPLIDVNGEPMIKRIVDNINIDANYIFIVQQKHYEDFNLKYLLNLIAPNCKIICVDHITEGAACTVLLTKDLINTNDPLLIANSDQYIDWNSNDFMYTMENSSLDGCILTFESTHPKWSFVKLDEHNLVNEVAEKKPISNIATVGIYYWNKGKDFVRYAQQMIEKNIRINNEFYVCPVFNEAIQDNKKIRTYHIKNMYGLGTPEDLEIFLKINQ
jgi:HAD superfamily hydrolase (TIGR01509 family)